MTAGRGDLERAPRERAGRARRRSRRAIVSGGAPPAVRGDEPRRGLRIVQRADGLGERSTRDRSRRPSTTAASLRVGRRQQQAAKPRAPRRRGDRQHAARRLDAAVERQLAEDQHVVDDRAAAITPDAAQHAERDRQIERRARLAHVGRREADA